MEKEDSLGGDAASVDQKDPVSKLEDDHEINGCKVLHPVADALDLDEEKLHFDLEVDGGSDKQNMDNTAQECKNLDKQMEDGKCEEIKALDSVNDDNETIAYKSTITNSFDLDQDPQVSVWPEKAVALKNFVKEKGAIAVSTVFRRLSGIKDEQEETVIVGEDMNGDANEEENFSGESKSENASPRTWNPLSFIKIGWDADLQNKAEDIKDFAMECPKETPVKGRIVVYTKLGCQESKQVRLLLHQKSLKYVEINVDVYPGRKLELEKNTGSSVIPRIYFNDLLIGGLAELMALDESGKLQEKINYLASDDPSPAAPSPPLPGEDDPSGSGTIDELAVIVKRMKASIVVKDRFYKMRRFNSCFLGSEAVDFLSEDQYLEKEEAVQFGRKFVQCHFFHHILNENVFEDGNHLYRFLEDDPVMTQCYNIPKVAIDVNPKPVLEIAARLRLLSYAIFEAYTSEDGKHVDYKSIHISEEFKRYTRIISELQRVDLQDISREEKLAFFINLYNMMVIHAILTWGYPTGTLERRKFFGDFKYIIGGCPYSLSAIQNGILRGNQRPPYNLGKPFGPKDNRSLVALPYPEPLVHFSLVFGTRSGPALRCYSPGNIDKELMEAARDFLRTGGLVFDIDSKVVSVSKILKWFSVDFGKNEAEVIKHAANYLEPSNSEALLEVLAMSQLKVTYQPYDWGLNH